jgi:hypothetical protein
MRTVFFGGSRRITRLDPVLRAHIDKELEESDVVLIGDASGADKAIQVYLAENHRADVIVYCSGEMCRNNVGQWMTNRVETQRQKRDLEFYRVKDRAMADRADFGFMVWDGRSRGTILNVVDLLEKGKHAIVYFQPDKAVSKIEDRRSLEKLLNRNGSEMSLERLDRFGSTPTPSRAQLALNLGGPDA